MSAILTVLGLDKSFGQRHVLHGVSLSVHERDRIGLIGRNGAGKSTLLKMLVGANRGVGLADDEVRGLEPDAGSITWRRDLRLEYVSQEPRLDPEAAVGAVLARGGQVPLHAIQTLAAALDLPPLEQLMGTLSIGQRRRVALGRALLGGADVLALDEPTNHLDARTVTFLEERLGSWPGALIVVTHDRYLLDRVATRMVELDRGDLHSYEGDYSTFLEKQAERLSTEANDEHERAMFVRRELDWVRRQPKARSVKAKARLDRFDSAVSSAPTAEDAVLGAMALRLPTGPRLGRTILDLTKVSRRLGGRTLFEGLTLTMKAGDRIGIVGPNGAGKSTLLRTILGIDPPDAGKVVVGQNTMFSYLEQGRTELREDATVLAEVADGSDHVLLEDGPVHVRSFLKMLQFADATADTPIAKLSGGERNRVQLARLLRRGGNLLVLDEPTNDLDLLTLGALEGALARFPGCALIVSHDRWFLDRVATGILAFEEDGKVVFHEGDYTTYMTRRKAALAATPAASVTAPPRPAATRGNGERVAATGPRKISFKERQELAAIEPLIHAAEARVAELEATLSDPAVFKDQGAEVPALIAALDAARLDVDRVYARWQELEALAAATPA